MVTGRTLICGAKRQDQWCAGMVQPDLGRIDPVPMADLALRQEEIDAGAAGAVRLLFRIVSAPSLAIPAALWMGSKRKVGDDFVCSHGRSRT